ERFWRKHRSEDTDHEIKGPIRQLLQIRGITFLKAAVRQAQFRRTLISSLHQVARDIDSHYIGSQFRGRQCRSPIAASQIENLHPFGDSETLHKRVAAFAHCFGNPCEITFFPECFVWIHREHEVVGSAFPWQILSDSACNASPAQTLRVSRE